MGGAALCSGPARLPRAPALPPAALLPYAPGRGARPYDSGPSRQRIGNARAALRHPGGIAVRSLAHLA
ncbi:hypothetical protein JBE27_07555 [Streptomyces albiflaviniger]|nr:hypothetical protein [Streptomyces albiflaviniger]